MPEPIRAYGTMNTIRALEHLATAPRSAPELAAAIQISIVPARRILKRLALEGYAFQEDDHRRRYHLTPRLAHLGRIVERSYGVE